MKAPPPRPTLVDVASAFADHLVRCAPCEGGMDRALLCSDGAILFHACMSLGDPDEVEAALRAAFQRRVRIH